MARWVAGQTIGRYRLRRKLGAGTFAEVWLAVESSSLGFQKEVALKLLKAGDDEKQIADLLREARLSACLRHPNVVDVLGVDEDDGLFHVAMEFVDGGTLRSLIDRVALSGADFPLSVAVDLAIGICRGLEHAHKAIGPNGEALAIIHRDLKPENVLIDATGTAKLTDFGIAKVLGEGTATEAGMLKGTAAYVAPEIWKGGRDFHPRVDLFAVGCILYELVTLERLFEGQIQSIFGQVALRTAREEVGPIQAAFPELAPVVERLLQRDPLKRYQHADEVIEALDDLRAGLHPAADVGSFLSLLGRAEQPDPERDNPSLARIRTHPDPRWAGLAARAVGEPAPPVPRNTQGSGSMTAGTLPLQASPQPVPAGPPPVLMEVEPPATDETLPTQPSGSGTQSMVLPTNPGQRRRRLMVLVWSATAVVAAGLVLLVMTRRTETVPDTGQPTPAPTADLLSDLSVDEVLAELESGQPTPEPRPEPSARPTPSPTPSAAQEAPTPEEPVVEEPDVEQADEATEPAPEAEPEPTVEAVEVEVVEPTPEPGPVPTEACLVLRSRPVGAEVWIDGVKSNRRALSSSQGNLRTPGSVVVGMGSGGTPAASAVVDLVAGEGVRVDCELVVSKTCSVQAISFGTCGR